MRFWLVAGIAAGSILTGSIGCSSGSSGNASPADAQADGGRDADVETVDATTPDGDAASFDGAPVLSATGLYADVRSGALAANVLAYDVRYPLWSDGASKQRWLLLPAGATIDTSDMDDWRFPVGTKAWKEFRHNGLRLETRLLEKTSAGSGADAWRMVSYRWRADGTDADAVPDGATGVGDGTWNVPDQEKCLQCHSGVSDVLVGVSAIQLSAADGHGALSKLAAAGLLSAPPSGEFQVPGTGIVRDALGYLHGNCGQCHNDTGFLAKIRTMRLRLRVADTTPESTPAYTTAIGAPMSHTWPGGPSVAVAPGEPKGSQLLFRMRSLDGYRMPPIGTDVVDDAGVATIQQWISSA